MAPGVNDEDGAEVERGDLDDRGAVDVGADVGRDEGDVLRVEAEELRRRRALDVVEKSRAGEVALVFGLDDGDLAVEAQDREAIAQKNILASTGGVAEGVVEADSPHRAGAAVLRVGEVARRVGSYEGRVAPAARLDADAQRDVPSVVELRERPAEKLVPFESHPGPVFAVVVAEDDVAAVDVLLYPQENEALVLLDVGADASGDKGVADLGHVRRVVAPLEEGDSSGGL